MKNIIKFILIWSICSFIAVWTLKEVRPDHKVDLGSMVFFVVTAPISALVGTVSYLQKVPWDKCIIGECNK